MVMLSVCDGLAVFSRSCADVGDPLLPSCDAELSGVKDDCYAPVLVSTSPGVYCARHVQLEPFHYIQSSNDLFK